MKSLYHHLEQDNNLQALSASPTLYHLATADPRACMLTPNPPDDQTVYYQSRASTMISSPVLYHTANQHYSGSSTTLLGGSPLASHPASTPSQCVSARAPVGKLSEGPQVGESFEACLVSRHQTFMQTALPLGKSPPSRHIQGQVQGKVVCRIEPSRGNHEERAPERVTVKQENLSYTHLEDGEYLECKLIRGHLNQLCPSHLSERSSPLSQTVFMTLNRQNSKLQQ